MTNLKPGKTIDRYKIIRELGSGGFGITYLAESEDLGIKVAVKEYFPEEFALRRGSAVRARNNEQKNFEWGKKRFLQEARTLAKFRNPNIVGVRQIFEENNTAYMVLDYESGRSLKAWRKEINDRPTEEELIEISRPILAALEVIHRNDLLHRDISPENIIIRNDGSPVLIDFGSSRSMVKKTHTVSAMVKSGYSPPELYSTLSDSQGPWSDIYSYAATIHFLITGEVPEEATNRLIRDRLPSLTDTMSGKYSANFLSAMDAALCLKPESRPQSVNEWEIKLGFATSRTAAEASRQREEPTYKKISPAAPNTQSNILGFAAASALAILLIAGYLVSQPKQDQTEISQIETTIPEPDQAAPNGINTVELCSKALDASRLDWSSSASATNEVSFAKRANITVAECRAVLGVVDVPSSYPKLDYSLAGIENKSLCASALNVQLIDWDSSSIYRDKVNEAQRRGLTIDDCRKELGVNRETVVGNGLSETANATLCYWALNTDKTDWDNSGLYSQNVIEAQRRGLSILNCRNELGGRKQIKDSLLSSQQASANFTIFEGEDLWGGDRYVNNEVLRTQEETVRDCSFTCDADPQCDAFTYIESSEVCYLKNFSTGFGKDGTEAFWMDNKIYLWGYPAISGVRNTALTRTEKTNMEYSSGVFILGQSYSKPNIDPSMYEHLNCAIKCWSDDKCIAYNWINSQCQLMSTMTGVQVNPKSQAGKKR